MTAYFRIKGAPGERSLVRLCDGALEVRGTGSCERNFLLYEGESVFESVYARSTRHVSGQVAVIPGPATHPDPPSLPPDAEAYPEAPTAETAGIRFELSGAVAQPGARDVPLEVHVTSNHEWSGFSLSVAFPAGLLEAARVEEHTRPGVIRLDNERGFVGMVMTNSRRRIGAEGERVHLATIHVNLKEAAAEAGEVLLAFEPRDGFLNWLAIHHRERVNPEALPITAEVEPLFVARGLLRVQTRATAPGDVNLDYELNLTDPVVLLNALFLDEEILCPEAGDFNEDAQVNVSDAVAILNHLFLGGRRPAPREVLCGASGE
jgi:hypothetical protein